MNVTPVDPAMSMSVSYWRKLGGQPYGPSRNTVKGFSLAGEDVLGS